MVYGWVLIQFSSRFQYFEIYWDLVCSPVYGLSWWTQHIHLKRIYNLQLLGVVFYIYKLGQSGWWCCSDLLCLDWYFQSCSISYLEKHWSPTMFEYLSISSFTFSVFASGILKFCYEAHIFIIFIAFWYINFFGHNCVFKSIFCAIGIASLSFLCILFMWISFPSLSFQSICIFLFKVGILQHIVDFFFLF